MAAEMRLPSGDRLRMGGDTSEGHVGGFYLPTSVRQRKHAESLAVLEAKWKGIQQASPGAFSEGTAPVTEALNL